MSEPATDAEVKEIRWEAVEGYGIQPLRVIKILARLDAERARAEAAEAKLAAAEHLLTWCRPRLKHDAYRNTLDDYRANPREPDTATKIVASAALRALADEKEAAQDARARATDPEIERDLERALAEDGRTGTKWLVAELAAIVCGAVAAERAAREAAEAKLATAREWAEWALMCTPSVRDGEIIYDCGDPWELLRGAIRAMGGGDIDKGESET